MSSLLGTTLGGRYRLESRIGSGGMSTVYRAQDETLERFVAIKVMNREVATDSDQLERFRREARAVARLSHPNIVHVIDAGEDEGRPYIVFEYIEGETLKDRIRRLERLEIPEAVAYCIEIARALSAAHAHQIVHRDVKPQNVLIDTEGTAKVTDFGIARTLEEEGLTDDGRVLGTTDYVAPEQAMGQPVSSQSDIYSLGVVLYEMLTGQLPYKAETQVGVAMKHVREDFPDVRKLRPEVSATLASVIETATDKELSERYVDDDEMIADLEKVLALETTRAGTADGEVTTVLETLPPETRRRVPLSVRRRRLVLVLLGLAAVAVAAVIVLLATRAQPGHPGGGGGGGSTVAKVSICPTCAVAYNPDGHGGIAQNGAEAHYAVDGDQSTAWTTETYYTGQLNKTGVGIYVYAPSPVAATELKLYTTTPGFTAAIYGTSSQPDLHDFNASNWVGLTHSVEVAALRNFRLNTGGHDYRYYLVWITELPQGHESAAVNEVELYR
jgi:eukaryotic-like serine/threonine-protein kinase